MSEADRFAAQVQNGFDGILQGARSRPPVGIQMEAMRSPVRTVSPVRVLSGVSSPPGLELRKTSTSRKVMGMIHWGYFLIGIALGILTLLLLKRIIPFYKNKQKKKKS